MNYLEALKLIEDGKIVRCNENGLLFRKNNVKIDFKIENGKNWEISASGINWFIQLTFEEYIESQIPLDTPMDARILVSDDGITWYKRHFKCFNKDNNVIVWCDGRTSFTSHREEDCAKWEYAKLASEEEINET